MIWGGRRETGREGRKESRSDVDVVFMYEVLKTVFLKMK